jgi:sulfotransferase family protein
MTLNGTTIEERISPQDQRVSRLFSGPVFVTGVWRSGTSLLYALLNQHPDLGLFYEGDLPVLRPVFRLGYSRKNWVRRWEYWNAGVSRHGLDERRLPASITSLTEAAEAAGQEYCRKKGARIWGCKSPSYYDRLVGLAHDFPQARFVVIWRDPEEICRSVIDAAAHSRWFAGSGRMHRAILASEVLKKQCDALVGLGVPVHQLCYKDLVGDTAKTVRGICEFLEIPFVPAVTTLEGADRSAVFGGAHHSMVKGKQIVAARERKDMLPPQIKEKIRQYKALWRNENGAESLFSRSFGEISESTPGKWERFADRLRFSLLSIKDEAPRVAYSVLPVWTWQAYRAIKYRDLTYLKYHNRLFIDEPTPKKQAGYVPDRQDT